MALVEEVVAVPIDSLHVAEQNQGRASSGDQGKPGRGRSISGAGGKPPDDGGTGG
jgi:hypothetical protein